MTKYIFNAVFTYDYDGISINFPDLPGCISCGFSTMMQFKWLKKHWNYILKECRMMKYLRQVQLQKLK